MVLAEFQSTHPLRDATYGIFKNEEPTAISIHAPLTGCDIHEYFANSRIEGISIHAPLTGCDITGHYWINEQRYFNPRTPYGMRHYRRKTYEELTQFQSTHPLRDATKWRPFRCENADNFNPRTPYGMRLWVLPRSSLQLLFQSTHPLRDATMMIRLLNIHKIFQSTHPLRDATCCKPRKNVSELISIHAPLTGCDLIHRLHLLAVSLFQSTHPLRDATSTIQNTSRTTGFQSTHPLRDATAKKAKSSLEFHSFWQIHIIIFTELW